MRIYLTQAMEVSKVLESGRSLLVSYPGAGFYNVDDELGESWLEAGFAFRATNNNKIVAYVGTDRVELDTDLGQKPGPEHTRDPVETPVVHHLDEPVNPVVTAEET